MVQVLKLTNAGTLNATVEQTEKTKVDMALKNISYAPELLINLFSNTT